MYKGASATEVSPASSFVWHVQAARSGSTTSPSNPTTMYKILLLTLLPFAVADAPTFTFPDFTDLPTNFPTNFASLTANLPSKLSSLTANLPTGFLSSLSAELTATTFPTDIFPTGIFPSSFPTSFPTDTADIIFGTFPSCAQSCLEKSYSNNCDNDISRKCLCGNKAFIQGAASCADPKCNSQDQNTVLNMAKADCSFYGLTFDQGAWNSAPKSGSKSGAVGS
jgi:hypothetical protein